MTGMNWDRVRQENLARKYGRDYATDASGPEEEFIDLKRKLGPVPKIKYGTSSARRKPVKPPREKVQCPECGQMVTRLLRHLKKAHGHSIESAQIGEPKKAL